MSIELENNPGFASQRSAPWLRIWQKALTQPTVTTYQDLIGWAGDGARETWIWLFASSLISGLLISLEPLFTGASQTLDFGLALAIPIFAIIAVLVWWLFAGCMHFTARPLKGTGAYANLIYLFAAFSAPLMLLASVLSLVPRSGPLLIGLYLYWLALFVVATQAVHRFSRVRAVVSVLVALLVSAALLGSVVLGLGWWVLALGN
jgi:hypothetical protein